MADNSGDQQATSDQSDNQEAGQKSHADTPPSMNVLEATGIALFKNVEESKINHPGPGEVKRSFRLTRLLIVITLAVLSFIIVIALLAHPLAGILKLIGVLLFLAFTIRCVYVSVMLWKKLQ